ncbi:MAG TPA: hypothetical protein VJ998_05025, partial [Pseudomonadales bacterium]|nr:hypothetical protein [Pseudomonadales bacterium]
KETLNRLARTSNPDWYLRTVEDVLVKRVPVPLFEYLFRLPPEQREKEFKSAMDKLERANPDNVVEIAAKYDDDLGQRTKGVLLDLVRLDHDPIALVDKYHIDLPEQSLADLIEQFAYRHPKAAGRYLSRMDEKTKQRVISRIAYFYRDKFKEDYKEWLEENPEWMSRSDKSRLQAKKAESSAGTQDVAAALESVVLPESRLQQDAVAAFTRIVKQDPKGARDWADKTTRKVPDTAIAIIADLLDQQRRPDTYEWLSGFPESRRLRQVRIDSFDLLAHSDPARASTLVGTMPADRRMPAIHAVLQEWLDKDTGAAMSWIRTVAPGPERDEAMLDAGDYLVQADMDYQSALKLYGMIGNPNSRRLAVMNIMPLIYLKDTDTFSALAKRYGFDQDQLSEFKQTASHIKLVNGHL